MRKQCREAEGAKAKCLKFWLSLLIALFFEVFQSDDEVLQKFIFALAALMF